MMLTVLCTLMVASVCMASNGKALDRAQDSAERFVAAFAVNQAPYSETVLGFSRDLKSKISAEAYVELQKQVTERFGSVKESKFYSYQCYEDSDRLTYLTACTKERIVGFVITCDKKGKIIDFSINPVQLQTKAE